MARAFDAAFIEVVGARIAALPEDATPRWGRMTKQDLVEHLLAALGFSLGEVKADIPYQVGPWTRRFLKFLVLGLRWPFLRNVVFKDAQGRPLPLPKRQGTPAQLRIALEKMARATEVDVPSPPPHPYFGPLTLAEWKRLQVRHIAHHLNQFGVPLGA